MVLSQLRLYILQSAAYLPCSSLMTPYTIVYTRPVRMDATAKMRAVRINRWNLQNSSCRQASPEQQTLPSQKVFHWKDSSLPYPRSGIPRSFTNYAVACPGAVEVGLGIFGEKFHIFNIYKTNISREHWSRSCHGQLQSYL